MVSRNSTFSLFIVSIIALSSFFGTPNALQGQTFAPENFTEERFKQYEQQLNAILKTRRDEERLFVSRLVAEVRAGRLPSKLVQTSFRWVQNKRPDTNFPFIYFERLLRLQADKAGIPNTIPPYDFDIYREFDNGTRPFVRGGSPTTQGPGLGSDRTTFNR